MNGTGTSTSCLVLGPDTGDWARTLVPLQEERWDHVAWPGDTGLLLLGGAASPLTSELVSWSGTTERAFNLTHRTQCVGIAYRVKFLEA